MGLFGKDAQEWYEEAENYMYGKNGFSKDYIKAAHAYEKAYAKNHPGPFVKLAFIYFTVINTPDNLKKGFELCCKEAEKGDKIVYNNLGVCYQQGVGTEKNEALAMKYFKMAADKNYGDAARVYGYNKYKSVTESVEDYFESRKYFEIALNNTSSITKENLDKLKTDYEKYFNDLSNKDIEGMTINDVVGKGYDFYVGNNGMPKDVKESFRWYRYAADKGHAGSQRWLGDCYRLGTIDGKVDYKIAMSYYMKAIAQGNALAMRNVSYIFHGEGNNDDAVKYLKMAMEKGDEEAEKLLFKWYPMEREIFNVLQKKKAFLSDDAKEKDIIRWILCIFEYKLTENDDDYYISWGIRLFNSLNTENPSSDLYVLYAYMCEKGFRNEQDTPDIESADKYYSESVGIGGPEMPETQLLLGEYYFNRWNDCDYTLPGDNDDPSFEDVLKSRAAYWYKKAADNGNVKAMYHYGRCCLYGIGCDENIDTALSYLEKALNEGNVNAGLLLSTHYASLIKSNNDSNFKKAVSYCAKAYDVAAYDFEKSDACGSLSRLYYQSEEYRKAYNYAKEGAELGDGNSMLILALMYNFGNYVGKDVNKARDYILMAKKTPCRFMAEQLSKSMNL